MQLLVGKWMPELLQLLGSVKLEAETMEHYPKSGEGGIFILITNGLCIAPWKNTEIEYYPYGWFIFKFIFSLHARESAQG